MQIVLCSLLLGIAHSCTSIGRLPGVPKNIASSDGITNECSCSEEWFSLPFEGPRLIDEIQVHSVDGYAHNLVGASVYVNDVQVGIVWDNSTDPVIFSFSDLYVVGTSLKIGGGGLPLLPFQVEVFGDDFCDPTVNIAGEGTASQIDTLYHDKLYIGVAEKAIDGDTDGDFFAKSVTHTDHNADAWWRLTFDEERWICSIILYNRMDCCQSRLDGVTVYVGDTLVGTVNYIDGQQSYEFVNVEEFNNTITINSGGEALSLAEVEVFEC